MSGQIIPPHDVECEDLPCRCCLQQVGDSLVVVAVGDEHDDDVCQRAAGLVLDTRRVSELEAAIVAIKAELMRAGYDVSGSLTNTVTAVRAACEAAERRRG